MRFPIYLISLETDEGRRRRARTNYKYRLVRGVLGDDVDERFKMTQRSLAFASRAKGAHRSGKIGCFHSHVKAWREVLRHGDSGAVVVEDDAILCRTTGALAGLDVRGIVLLGGCLRCPCSWRKEARDHLRTGNFLKAFQRLHVGYNALPRGSKITGTLAYYVPPGVARLLLKFYQRYLRSGLAFHEVDQWLMLNGLIKGLMFPNLFIDQDDQIASQCGSNLGDQFSDLYFNRTYRRAARHHGVPLPPRGCSSKVALSWLSGIKRTRVDPDGFAAREERRRLRMNRRTAIAKLGRRLLRLE